MHDLIPLSMLPVGRQALIDSIVGRADEVHRLHELGLRDGASIEMLQSGSPCIIRLAGHKLCFRADELLSVLVRQGADL